MIGGDLLLLHYYYQLKRLFRNRRMVDSCLFTRPPNANEPLEASEAWCQRINSLCSLLNDALALSAVDFWRYVTADDTLLLCIDSYLRNTERSFEFEHAALNWKVRRCVVDVDRAVFLCCLRMSTYREIGNNSEFSRARWATIIYERFLFDIPRLLDFSAVYGRRNAALVSRMLEQIFDSAPRYASDYELCVRAIADTVLEKLSKRIKDLIGDAQGDLSTSLNDVLAFLHDLIETLRVFTSVLPSSASMFLDSEFLEKFVHFYNDSMPFLVRAKTQIGNRTDSAHRLRVVRIGALRFFTELLDAACLRPMRDVLTGKPDTNHAQAESEVGAANVSSSSTVGNTKRSRNAALNALQNIGTITPNRSDETSNNGLASRLTMSRCTERLENVLRTAVLAGSTSSRFAAHVGRFTDTERKLNELLALLGDTQLEEVDTFALRHCCEAAIAELIHGGDRKSGIATSSNASTTVKKDSQAAANPSAASAAPDSNSSVTDAEFEYVHAVLPEITRERVAAYLKHYRSVDAFLNAALEFGLPELDVGADADDAEGVLDAETEVEYAPTPAPAAAPEPAPQSVMVSAFRKRGTGMSKREFAQTDDSLRERTLALASQIEDAEEAARLEYEDERDDAYEESARPTNALLRHGSDSSDTEQQGAELAATDAALERAYGRPIATPRIFEQRGITRPPPVDVHRRQPAAVPIPAPAPAPNDQAQRQQAMFARPPQTDTSTKAKPPKRPNDAPRGGRDRNTDQRKPNRGFQNHFDETAERASDDDGHPAVGENTSRRGGGPRQPARPGPASGHGPGPASGPGPAAQQRNQPPMRGGNAGRYGPRNPNAPGSGPGYGRGFDERQRPPHGAAAGRAPFGNERQADYTQADGGGSDEDEEGGADNDADAGRGPGSSQTRGHSGNTPHDRQAKERNKAYAGNHNRKALAARKQNRY